MIITLYNFAKRTNSTKRPASGGTQFDVYLKDNCSRERPVFVITGVDWQYNYLQWGDHYYYIDDIIILTNDHMELHCTEDVLATYRDDIGAYTAFIERSSNTYDPMLIDSMLSAQQDIVNTRGVTTQLSDDNWGLNPSPGTYLLQMMSDKGVNIYAFDSLDDIQGILNYQNYGFNSTSFQNLLNSIGLNLVDLSAFVSSVTWIPFSKADLATTQAACEFSFWTLSNTLFDRVDTRTINIAGTINKPQNMYSDFRAHYDAFSRYTLYLPGIGSVGISALDCSTDMTYSMTFDIFTGDVQYLIYNNIDGVTHLIGTYAGKLGVTVPWCALRQDAWQLMHNVLAPNINMGGGYASMASGLAGGIIDTVQNVVSPQASINSAVGNMSEITLRPYIMLSVANYGSKVYPLPYAGRPLCEIAQISTLPGYIKCGMPALEIAGLASEREQVNSYLAAGFYFE